MQTFPVKLILLSRSSDNIEAISLFPEIPLEMGKFCSKIKFLNFTFGVFMGTTIQESRKSIGSIACHLFDSEIQHHSSINALICILIMYIIYVYLSCGTLHV